MIPAQDLFEVHLTVTDLTSASMGNRPTSQWSLAGCCLRFSMFFRDPDGELLEYIAMLPEPPQPERGVVPWQVWNASRDDHSHAEGTGSGAIRDSTIEVAMTTGAQLHSNVEMPTRS